MTDQQTALRTIVLSIGGNLLLALAKGAAGVLGNSYALVADAIESTTDIFASLLVLLGLRYAHKPADADHPYGHGRIEPLVTFAVVGLLLVSAGVITYQALQHISAPQTPPAAWTLLVLAVIIAYKEGAYRYVLRKSKQTGSGSLAADAWHHRSDAITSAAAFVGISAARYLGPGFEAADDWAAIFAAAIIVFNACRIFRPAFGEIMDENLHDELITRIRAEALEVKGVRGTEKCFVRKLGRHYHVDLHALVDAEITVREGHRIAHDLKDELLAGIPRLKDVHIHVEPFDPAATFD